MRWVGGVIPNSLSTSISISFSSSCSFLCFLGTEGRAGDSIEVEGLLGVFSSLILIVDLGIFEREEDMMIEEAREVVVGLRGLEQ